MARLPRLYAPDTPHLVQAVLLPSEYEPTVQVLDAWAAWLEAETARLRIGVHGWVLTPGELLLLATPAGPHGLRSLLQSLGRRISTQRGGGAVFSGRYRSTLVEPGAWVLPALVWLETLPVRAGLASDAEYWRWSSARAHAGAGVCGWLTEHEDYWACGNTPFDRQAFYRRLLHEGLGAKAQAGLDAALHGQWALGGAAFLQRIGQSASRRIEPRPRGRPPKSATTARAKGSE